MRINSNYILVQLEIPIKRFLASWLENITYLTAYKEDNKKHKESDLFDLEYKKIISLDGEGSSFYKGKTIVIFSATTINIKDTIRAGTPLNGALLASVNKSHTLEKACKLAVDAVSISTTKVREQAGMLIY